MRRFCIGLIMALLFCGAFSFFHRVEWVNDTPINSDGSINIPGDGSRYIPAEGDMIRCDDGTNYTILCVDGYVDNGPLPSISEEWPKDELPKEKTIHYADGSGDYLFVRDLYETLRMVYTLCGREDRSGPLHVSLTIPEDLSSDAFSSWDAERVITAAHAGRGDTVCLEAWDMFKDGVYYKTLYEVGVARGEAGHE